MTTAGLSRAGKLWFWLAVVLALMLTVNALSYANFDPTYGFLRLKQNAIASGIYLPFYYAHVLVSGLILVAGLFQIHPVSRSRFPRAHRLLGKFYVGGILFFAGPGAVIMTMFIGRGNIVMTSFLVQSALWFYFTWQAYAAIRSAKITEHKHWMWRSFALTFAAITLRLYILMSSWSVDLSQPEGYAVLSWMSWIPNLVIVELIVWRTGRRSAVNTSGVKV
jgi:hypothetical protein